MKKIAFVGNTAFSLYNFRLGVMKSFLADYKVSAIAPYDSYSPLLEKEGIHFLSIDIDRKGKNPIHDINFIIGLYRIYKKENFDFIFHYTIKPVIYGSLVSSFLKINSIAITTGLGSTFSSRNLTNRIVCALYKVALRQVSKVWFLNNEDENTFIDNGIIECNKCFVLPSEGVDMNYFHPMKDTEHNGFSFLLSSRLLKEKGIKEFAGAAQIIKQNHHECDFILLGDIEENNNEYITKTDIEYWVKSGIIIYKGITSDVRPYIAESDCIVLPSYYREGIPRCLLEAMSMAKPIITTRNVGCENLVGDGINGFLCNKKSISDLAEKMEKMITLSPEQRKEMGLKGLSMVKNKYSENQIINIYQEAIKDGI